MKKKYILVLTFLLMLCGQVSFGQNPGDDGEYDNGENLTTKEQIEIIEDDCNCRVTSFSTDEDGNVIGWKDEDGEPHGEERFVSNSDVSDYVKDIDVIIVDPVEPEWQPIYFEYEDPMPYDTSGYDDITDDDFCYFFPHLCEDAGGNAENSTTTDPPPCEKPCTATQRSLTGKPAGAMCPCEDNFKREWYIDRDGDGYSSVIAYLDAFNLNPGYPYILTRFGPDCDDSLTTGANVNKINSCGVCAVEPADGKCPCKTSAADLKAMFGLSDTKATQLADLLNKYAGKFGIDTKEKLQHFLAQAGVETDNFNDFIESTNFQPKIVMLKFGKYFNNLGNNNTDTKKNNLSSIYTVGNKYVDGEKLFNIVYDDRNTLRDRDNLLGNTQDGDGYLFRGRGALHLTGRENYDKFTTFYNSVSGTSPKDFTKTPDDLKNNFEIAIVAGLWFFQENVLKAKPTFQSQAESQDPIKQIKLIKSVSKIVNGGGNDLPKRTNLLNDSKTKIKCN